MENTEQQLEELQTEVSRLRAENQRLTDETVNLAQSVLGLLQETVEQEVRLAELRESQRLCLEALACLTLTSVRQEWSTLEQDLERAARTLLLSSDAGQRVVKYYDTYFRHRLVEEVRSLALWRHVRVNAVQSGESFGLRVTLEAKR